MSDTSVPVRTGQAVPVVPPTGVKPASLGEEPRKLDDVMLAMDVVDTLRHRTRIVDMELNESAREEQLVARLREIYGAQGIEVPDRILKDGVKALAEQRFVYRPPRNTFSVRLAKAYVNRKRWLPQMVTAVGLLAAIAVGFQLLVFGPMNAEWQNMPNTISAELAEGQALATDPAVDAQLASLAAEGQRAVASGDRDTARTQLKTLQGMNDQLAQEYDIRIVSRPDEDTGFWRQANDQPNAMNYYLVVEAVAAGGRVLRVPIRSVEEQTTENVSMWAQRVDKATFDRVAAEKQSSGMVVNDILGRKTRGVLEPQFDTPMPGGAITEW
jgi:hypothetical protein